MDDTMERFYRKESKHTYICAHCGKEIIEMGDRYENYFKNTIIKCSECGCGINLFKELNKDIENRGSFLMTSLPLMTLGVKTEIFTTKVKSNEIKEIDLKERGIPQNAEILSVNYTMKSSCEKDDVFLSPLEIHGNNSPYIRKYHDNKIFLYIANFSEIDSESRQKMNVLITWTDEVSLSRKNLITAFLYFSEGEWEKAIVPANVSLEYKLEAFLDKKLKELSKGNISNSNLNDFIKTDMTYSHQFYILLPLVVSISDSKYNSLPQEIKEQFKNLKKNRDILVHGGKLKEEITEGKVRRMLTAIFLTHIYIDLLIEENKSKGITSPVTPISF